MLIELYALTASGWTLADTYEYEHRPPDPEPKDGFRKSTKVYWGQRCRNDHVNAKGQSQRYQNTGNACVQCSREAKRRLRDKQRKLT